MGTDIYETWEIRRNGVWEVIKLVPEPDIDDDYDPTWTLFNAHPVTLVRVYALFSVLAGVRNRFGIVPIAPPRGVPADASAEVYGRYSDNKFYDVVSWVTLEELLAYDWEQTFVDSAHLDEGTQRLSEYLNWFTEGTLPYLQTVVSDPADLRMTFGFDDV